MQAPVLKVGKPETLLLDGGSELRQGRQVGAWEDVAQHPRIDRTGIALLGDGVENGHPVVSEERVEALEELVVARQADVLEHSD